MSEYTWKFLNKLFYFRVLDVPQYSYNNIIIIVTDVTTLFVLIFVLSHKKIHLRAKISTEFTLKKAMRKI